MLTAYTDGASRGNPGQSSCAWVCYEEGYEIATYYEALGIGTNNAAEYIGLVKLLEWAVRCGYDNLEIFCDSILVVNQVNGLWKINKEELKASYTTARELMLKTNSTLKHCRGHHGVKGNERADQLCNEALDAQERLAK